MALRFPTPLIVLTAARVRAYERTVGRASGLVEGAGEGALEEIRLDGGSASGEGCEYAVRADEDRLTDFCQLIFITECGKDVREEWSY